ncbi:hypothetical protein CR513_42062, partial [Mucuna pruriens]
MSINGQDASSSKAPNLQYGKGAGQSRMVNEISVVDNLRLENQLTELTSLVRQLVVGQHQPSIVARVCEIESNHPESVGAIGGYQYGKQSYQIAILAEAGSRAICSSTIWTCPECTSRSSQLSTAESAISSTTFPTTPTTESASSRQLAIFGGFDEAASNKQSGVLAKYELQQHAIPAKHERHHPKPQDSNRTVSQYCEPFIVSRVWQPSLTNNSESEGEYEREPRPTDANSKPNADSRIPQQDRSIPLPFPTWTLSVKKPVSDEELLKMFWKVEINIPLLDAIKQIPKYAKFLKELCVNKRKKMKGRVESGGIVSVFTRNDEFTIGI